MVILFLWVCSSTSQRQHPAEYPSRAARSSTLQTHRLPRIGNLFRTDFRFAPSPRSASLAGPPIHEDMVVHGMCGRVPDSAGNVSPWIASAQTDPNLSAHLHRLPTPPPYLRQMRLLPGRGRRYPMGDKAAAWTGVQVFGVGYDCYLARCIVPENHRARFKNISV